MKNITKTMLAVAMLSLTILNSNCALSQLHSPPRLELRKLEISPDSASLYYQYSVCTRSFLGRCTRTEMKKDTYDLADRGVREKLRAAGFVVSVREKPIQ